MRLHHVSLVQNGIPSQDRIRHAFVARRAACHCLIGYMIFLASKKDCSVRCRTQHEVSRTSRVNRGGRNILSIKMTDTMRRSDKDLYSLIIS